jgi:hypothetical protein
VFHQQKPILHELEQQQGGEKRYDPDVDIYVGNKYDQTSNFVGWIVSHIPLVNETLVELFLTQPRKRL